MLSLICNTAKSINNFWIWTSCFTLSLFPQQFWCRETREIESDHWTESGLESEDRRPWHASKKDEPPTYNILACSTSTDLNQHTAIRLDSDLTKVKGVPPGLEPLLKMSQISVLEKFKVSQSWGSRSFDVLDDGGQRLFQAEMRAVCCGPLYNLVIRENGGSEVMQVLENCGCPCCPHEIELYCPAGNLASLGKLHWNAMVVTQMTLLDASREVLLHIVGPSLQTCIFGNSRFEVKSRDEQHEVGLIRMEGDHFLISFPLDLEVTVKAALLGAAMYLDNLIVEKKRSVERKARR